MCILKKKIALFRQTQETKTLEQVNQTSTQPINLAWPKTITLSIKTEESLKESPRKNSTSSIKSPIKSPKSKPETCQNIVKNYSRAFISFALSSTSLPYLNTILSKENLDVQEFYTYLAKKKSGINCIK